MRQLQRRQHHKTTKNSKQQPTGELTSAFALLAASSFSSTMPNRSMRFFLLASSSELSDLLVPCFPPAACKQTKHAGVAGRLDTEVGGKGNRPRTKIREPLRNSSGSSAPRDDRHNKNL